MEANMTFQSIRANNLAITMNAANPKDQSEIIGGCVVVGVFILLRIGMMFILDLPNISKSVTEIPEMIQIQ